MNRFLAGFMAAWLATGCSRVEKTPVRAVQGDVLPDDIATENISPIRGRTVLVEGRIAQHLMFASPEGVLRYGCMIEAPDGRAGESAAPAGLYIDLGTNRGTAAEADWGRIPPGEMVTVRGHVTEIDGTTSLADPRLIARSSGAPAPERAPGTADPPADRSEAARYWERRECTRCVIPAGSVVQGGRKETWWGHASYIYLLPPGAEVLARRDPPHRRAFRDAHPLDDRPDELFDNGNGYIICLGDAGVKFSSNDGSAKLPAVMTGDVLVHAVTGTVMQSYGEYLVYADRVPVFESGTAPAVIPMHADSGGDVIRVVSYNVENLYDHRDDPFDLRDFYVRTSDPEKPRMLENYVPADDAAYRRRIAGLAEQIVGDLRAPDILMIQEVEDQDLPPASIPASHSIADNHNGMPDALEALCEHIAQAGGPPYRAIYDRTGADGRGIVCAFMYRPDRMVLAEASGDDPVLGVMPRLPYAGLALTPASGLRNPRALHAYNESVGTVFSRAPLIGCFETTGKGKRQRLYVLNNHFKSVPNEYVETRIEQARFNAACARALADYDPEAWIIVGGDLNTFPRPDEPVPEEPADQLGALYDAGLVNLYDRMLAEQPASAYTYVYVGQAQTLDHLFISSNALGRLVQAATAHINCDYTRDDRFPGKAWSDHDPVMAVFAPRR